MKKSLIAVAVAAALPAVAQAQTSVTLYGIIDLGVSWKDRGTDAAGNKRSGASIDSGTQSTNRIGVRGTEDLGGGLSAVFNWEAGVASDTGLSSGAGCTTGGTFNNCATGVAGAGGALGNNGLAFTRRSVVGLSGGFGTVLLGRDYLPGFTSAGTTDIMGYGLYGNWLSWSVANTGASGLVAGLVGPATQNLTVRGSNGIHYISPNLGGLTIRAVYAMGEADVAPKRANDILGISGVYQAGPITAQAFYHRYTVVTTGTSTDNDKQYGIGGGWNFGLFRVLAQYAVADPAGADTAALGKARAGQIGAGVRLGPGELLASYIRITDDRVVTGSKPRADVVGIAYVYPMSKRTNLYATYGYTRNNVNSSYFVRASDYSVAPAAVGEDPKAFTVGVRHQF